MERFHLGRELKAEELAVGQEVILDQMDNPIRLAVTVTEVGENFVRFNKSQIKVRITPKGIFDSRGEEVIIFECFRIQ